MLINSDNHFKKLDMSYQPSSLDTIFRSDDEVKIIENDIESRPLNIPSLLEPTSQTDGQIEYEIRARSGETEIIPGRKTPSRGYNGDLLGPTIKLKKNQQVKIHTGNDMDEVTTYHWHGLIVDEASDGGPQMTIEPDETKTIDFNVDNEAATLWYHPHPHGLTSKQVYEGLGGMIIVEDENTERLKKHLPHEYGVDDIPVVVQDRFLVDGYKLDYDDIKSIDGTGGDTLLLNGTANATFDADGRYLRMRLLNGSNVTNFEFSLQNHTTFYQIATDGGLLNYPIELKHLFLSAGERAEIIIDLEGYKEEEVKLFVNGVTGVTIRRGENKNNADFNPNMSLRTEMLPVIQPHEVTKYPKKLMLMAGTDYRVSINGRKYDPDRIDTTQPLGEYQVWEIVNAKDEMENLIHPYHVHGVQFRILDRDGKIPPRNEQGWKDTVLVNPGETVHILLKFTKPGKFMYHCHILEHEEHGMMGHVEID
ncbi:multicopper oxidase family protein [Salinicoccus roseus]|uniref:multicopper oxidase family protein n=1 Tax=Salinicoccus roseus TaxID=45670 RepID=UPI002301F01A|nr:multicopper oxidase domain-containing protein [Salinicoccus roseus]